MNYNATNPNIVPWASTVERGFSVNKEVLALNLQETSLVAMRLVHSSMQAAKCKVADFVVNNALLSSCAHARNRYQMYLIERKAEQERTEKGQKRKALMEELTSAKKAKGDLEKVSKKLVNTADKKAKGFHSNESLVSRIKCCQI